MENFWWLYFIVQLDTLKAYSVSIATLLLIVGFIYLIVCAIEKVGKLKPVLVIVLGFIFMIISAILPSSKNATIIAAGIGITEAVKSETVKRIAGKSVAVIEQWLDEKQKKERK